MTEEQLAELTQVLELAKIAEQKAEELAQFTLEIDRKYEQRLAQLRVARKLQSKREIILTELIHYQKNLLSVFCSYQASRLRWLNLVIAIA